MRVPSSVGRVSRGVFRKSGALFSMPNSFCGRKPGVLSRPRSFRGQPDYFHIERRGFPTSKTPRAPRQMPLPVPNQRPHSGIRIRRSEKRSARRTERARRSDSAARRSDGRGRQDRMHDRRVVHLATNPTDPISRNPTQIRARGLCSNFGLKSYVEVGYRPRPVVGQPSVSCGLPPPHSESRSGKFSQSSPQSPDRP